MDEEEPPPAPDMRPMMRSLALTATGDFFLMIGLLFILLGIASFVTDFLGIKGSGEFSVGVALVAGAIVLLWRSREAMPAMRPPLPPMRKGNTSEDYR
ncbi:MAG: hypothetical protein AB1529_05830 [Candidatus Micrarchaeota archaeon]